MTAEQLKKKYGDEYPAAVLMEGVRLPLDRESRFVRTYYSKEENMAADVSRFMDESASMSFAELEAEWPNWSDLERLDFCNSCSWLHKQADYPDILRFIMEHGNQMQRSAIPSSVATTLPRDEAFEILQRNLQNFPVPHSCNFVQGLALTKHPQAESVLRRHFEKVWSHEKLWDDDKFMNWVAYDAEKCIQHLIELGAAPNEFEEQVRQLSAHVCSGNRDSCKRWLSKYFSWLK